MIEQVCGNNDANLHFFTKKSGAVHLTVEKDRGNFLLQAIGTRRSLDVLRTIVQTQINLYKELDSQQHRKVFYQPPPTQQAPPQQQPGQQYYRKK